MCVYIFPVPVDFPHLRNESTQVFLFIVVLGTCSINAKLSLCLGIVPPQIVPFVFVDEATNTGDTVGIQCIVNKGDLPVEMRWILNSSPVISGENGITILKLNQRTSSLNINNVEGMHRGLFKCLASNPAGTAEHSAELNVNGLCCSLSVM